MSEPSDAVKKWMQSFIISSPTPIIFTFAFSNHPPPLGPSGIQALNPCPADCPMYRRGRGCVTTRCIKTREQNIVEPAKIGEQPTE